MRLIRITCPQAWRTRPAHRQAPPSAHCARPRRRSSTYPRTFPRKPPTPPRVAPGAGPGRARLGWGPTPGYAARAADRTGRTGRAAGGRGSRLTDHRHGGASASHAGRGHRGSRPPTHRPRPETDPGGRARERGPRRAGPVADGAATATETPLRRACSSASTRPLRGRSSSAEQPASRPADRRLDPRWSRGTAGQAAGGPTCFLQRLPPHRRPQPDPRWICHEIVAGVWPCWRAPSQPGNDR